MPTPSESGKRGEWAAATDTPKRSVFGNYRAESASPPGSPACMADAGPAGKTQESQVVVDEAVARAFLYRFFAQTFSELTPDSWRWLGDTQTRNAVASAAGQLQDTLPPLAISLLDALRLHPLEAYLDACFAVFGHAARGSCPLNEIEYGDLNADPLFQPHRLADLAAFYRSFGLEVTDDAGERQDHLALELEFMCVLAAKEAYAADRRLDAVCIAQCREAQRKFLREHLGRWVPAFTRRLAAATNDPVLGALARFTRAFVECECARHSLSAGSDDLLLRPVDESADRLCETCGVAGLPPGALSQP